MFLEGNLERRTRWTRKRRVLIAVVALIACAGLVAARAGSNSSAWDKLGTLVTSKHFDDQFRLIHVKDLVAMRADPNSHAVIFDANVERTRDQYGIIPGARLLSSYDSYDVAKELPRSKNARLVFYCANTR
jgi:hypothetical protein